MPTPFWRSADVLDRLNRLDRPGFAAEFLRRNPDYRTDCQQVRRRVAEGALDLQTARAKLARRWGLCFCL